MLKVISTFNIAFLHDKYLLWNIVSDATLSIQKAFAPAVVILEYHHPRRKGCVPEILLGHTLSF